MSVLESLSPSRVFYYFEQICAIPHPSGMTAGVRDYCASVAERLSLPCRADDGGNLVICKPASRGYEGHPTVILQGHLDMVCEAVEGCKINFTKEGITPTVTGDTVRALGTTLGADNGIAVAMALAILEDTSLAHPPIEVLLTADEEIGLLGAGALDASLLSGRMLINLDSEDEGIFTVSCAGGVRADMRLPTVREAAVGYLSTIRLSGYCGGHSGIEINNGHRNAILDLLSLLSSVPALRIVSLSGGGKDNAIPRAAEACVLTETPIDEAALTSAISAFLEEEPDAELSVSATGYTDAEALTGSATQSLLEFAAALPNGVLKMSEDIADLVETSLNLGILEMNEDAVTFTSALRSSKNQARTELSDRLSALCRTFGGSYSTHGAYPAWEYRKDSPLRDTATAVFTKMYGHAPIIEAIHAGLECGLLSDKLPGLDSISIGPELHKVHTPEESLSISSVARTYAFVCKILEEL